MFFGETLNNTLIMGAAAADAESASDKVADRNRFADFPGEKPARAVREKWCRESRRKMSAEQTAVMRGAVPARLAAETAEFDVSLLPPLDGSANASDKDKRAQLIAQKVQENAQKAVYREARLREIRDGLAADLEAAHEAHARLAWGNLKTAHALPSHAGMQGSRFNVSTEILG